MRRGDDNSSLRYADKLEKQHELNLWGEYCGFLDLDPGRFQMIQERLMEEQIRLWSDSGLGQSILRGKKPRTIQEFRKMVPLTRYEDYADILLNHRTDMLPAPPVIWLETTWEGGRHPVKTAPYTKDMIESIDRNMLALMTIASSDEPNESLLRDGDRMLFGLAPLPYVTGLFPHILEKEIDFNFLPPVRTANAMSFGKRNKEGFKMGLESGIDGFFGMTSVIAYMTESFSKASEGSSGGSSAVRKLFSMSPSMALRFIRARKVCQKENRPMVPGDIFDLKALVCAGTDTRCYKEFLEKTWGKTPHEIFAGTEMSLLCTETYSHHGMVFFPDSCFPEFITEEDSLRSQREPGYEPETLLLSELKEGHNYELVITSLKGGAFARYRVGDMFRAVRMNGDNTTKLPLVQYIDRVNNVIDIAGFTRITENSIGDAIRLSRLPVVHCTAAKEWVDGKKPFLHLYLEIDPASVDSAAISAQVLREHLKVYFKFMDTDYDDLEKMLGIDPLKITLLKCGSFHQIIKETGREIPAINPGKHLINKLVSFGTMGER